MPHFLRHRFALIFMFLGALLSPLTARSQTPERISRVTDRAEVLSAEDSLSLARMLARYESQTTHQIAILTIPTLSGESIEAFSLRTANAWGLGCKDVNNGILIVLVPAKRKVRIELGLGFEPYISNSQASEIIQTQMLPAFRKKDYFKGLKNGLRELMRLGRALETPNN